LRLVLDIGNTKTAIGLWEGGALSSVINIDTNNFLTRLSRYKHKSIEQIYFVSVISSSQTKHIVQELKSLFGCKTIQIKSTSKLLSVSNGYKFPAKLGSDRWVSIVASYNLYQKSIFIVDCGTAISLDFINNEAKHLGGYILGGFQGYMNSFMDAYNLRGIKTKTMSFKSKRSMPTTTIEAVYKGYNLMIISSIESAFREFKKSNKQSPLLIISGGYGAKISKQLSIKNKFEPNLVIKSIGLISDSLENI